MIKRIVPLLVIVCMLSNVFLSLGIVRVNDFTRVLEVKQSLRQLGAAVALPASLIQGLVNGENPLSTGIKADGKDKRGGTGDSDFLMNGSAQKLSNEGRGQYSRLAGMQGDSPDVSGFALLYSNSLLHHWPPGWNGFVCLLFLAYLVVLFRSNLPGETAAACVRRE